MKKNTKTYQSNKRGMLYRLCFLLLAGLLSFTANASNTGRPTLSGSGLPPVNITGKVTDTKNVPLEGVSVFLKGTKKGVITDSQGAFTFKDVPENGTLVFTFSGFGTKEVTVKGSSSISVSLTEEVSGLSDVVVIGYGTQKKKDLTGAISQVKATQLENENPRSVQDMLRGNAPGLDVGFDPSTKGQSGSLQVRGAGSLTASTSPLIVLDGVI